MKVFVNAIFVNLNNLTHYFFLGKKLFFFNFQMLMREKLFENSLVH